MTSSPTSIKTPLDAKPRVAVIGSGIAGLSAAWHLKDQVQVVLFEAAPRAGGHAHTVDVRVASKHFGVDTGFLVFNHRTYPGITPFFSMLGVATAPADMGFSVQARAAGIEWAGNSIRSVFSQRKNLLNPRFWRMLIDILRFNRAATRYALKPPPTSQTIGDYLLAEGYSEAFRDWYLVPMAAAIWSCPTATMMGYPMATFTRFCYNHGLLQITGRPQWYTVAGGSRNYVNQVLKALPDVRLNQAVNKVLRDTQGATVVTGDGLERFDAVVFATHSDETLALLGAAATARERAVLAAIQYQRNTAVLHTDASVLPSKQRTWAAWNYESQASTAADSKQQVCLHYLLNYLQPLPVGLDTPVIVSLNPLPNRHPDPAKVLRTFDYAHPVFNASAIAAQGKLPGIQGAMRCWFAGAWTHYGFHEDGFQSGKVAASGVLKTLAAA